MISVRDLACHLYVVDIFVICLTPLSLFKLPHVSECLYHSAGHRGMKPGNTDGSRSLASVPYSPQQEEKRVGTTLILVPRGASNLFSRRGLGMRKRVVSHEVL